MADGGRRQPNPPDAILRLCRAWGPGSYETFCALGLRELAQDVEARLIEEFDERNARLARAAEKGGENVGADTLR